jgi:choloylglycine hydrolase
MCTDLMLKSPDGAYVHGRSMEFAAELNSQIALNGAGTNYKSVGADEGTGLTWTSLYNYVSMTAEDSMVAVDGLNDQGLSVGGLWLAEAVYPTDISGPTALEVSDFINWALGMNATVADVIAAIQPPSGAPSVVVYQNTSLGIVLTLHFTLYDATGDSAVIEYVSNGTGGSAISIITPNPVGVCTNDPQFAAQLINLNNYTGLQPQDAPGLTIGTVQLKDGHGSGMIGIPGDSTPPSRFARTAYLKNFATLDPNLTDPPQEPLGTYNLAFHLLNGVDIPYGVSAGQYPARSGPPTTGYDHTQWIVVKDLTNLVFQMRFYDNMLVYQVELANVTWPTTPAAYPVPPLPFATQAIDITSALVPSS